MRLKDYQEKQGKRVWLSEKELQSLIAVVDGEREERAALLLAGRCGLRRQELVEVTPADLVTTDIGRIVRVQDGKGGKYREVPCPDALADVALGMAKQPDDPLVSIDASTVWDWVNRAALERWQESGDEGWQYVGPHDLRRSWGVRLLESGVLPSVVMDWGGWNDWTTFRNHYLAEFSPEALRRERKKVSWLGGGAELEEPRQSYAAVRTGTDYR